MALQPVRAEDLQPGDRMYAGRQWEGGAVISRVYKVGEAAIPDRVYLVFTDEYSNRRVIRDWSATERLYIYPGEEV